MNIGSLQALHAISLNIFVIGISQILFFQNWYIYSYIFKMKLRYIMRIDLISDSEKYFLKKFFIARFYIKNEIYIFPKTKTYIL